MKLSLVETNKLSEIFHSHLRSGAAFEGLAGVVCFLLVERQVALVDTCNCSRCKCARQPLDQALRKSVGIWYAAPGDGLYHLQKAHLLVGQGLLRQFG
jgi:hypothetical protein